MRQPDLEYMLLNSFEYLRQEDFFIAQELLQGKSICELWVCFEGVIDMTMPPTRRGNANQFCRSNRDLYTSTTSMDVAVALLTTVLPRLRALRTTVLAPRSVESCASAVHIVKSHRFPAPPSGRGGTCRTSTARAWWRHTSTRSSRPAYVSPTTSLAPPAPRRARLEALRTA